MGRKQEDQRECYDNVPGAVYILQGKKMTRNYYTNTKKEQQGMKGLSVKWQAANHKCPYTCSNHQSLLGPH